MQSVVGKLKTFLANFPGTSLVTGLVCYLIVCVYIFEIVSDTDTFAYCLSFPQVFFSYQVFRLFTAPFFHSNFLHLLFNLVALLGIGPVVENQKGSILYALICSLLLLVSESLFLFLQFVLYFANQYSFAVPIPQSCVVGLSGLLFALLVIDCDRVSVRTIPLFGGRIAIRSQWLPWIFLLLTQALLPSVSFLGHLCGIVAGYVYIFGGFNWMLPCCDRIHRWEDRLWFSRLNSFSFHNDICCSATSSRQGSHSLFWYPTLRCPSGVLQKWLPWKKNTVEEDSKFPGKGYRLGEDSSSRLLSKQAKYPPATSPQQQQEDNKSNVTNAKDTVILAEDYGSASVNDTQK